MSYTAVQTVGRAFATTTQCDGSISCHPGATTQASDAEMKSRAAKFLDIILACPKGPRDMLLACHENEGFKDLKSKKFQKAIVEKFLRKPEAEQEKIIIDVINSVLKRLIGNFELNGKQLHQLELNGTLHFAQQLRQFLPPTKS